MEKIGFIGLGAMGLPMTKNIIHAGYDTYVVSRSRPPIEEAISLGAKEISSPKELMETVDILLTCLPFPQTVLDVYEGTNGITAGASEGKIIIDHSTINPEMSKRVGDQLSRKGAAFLDAPISGGPLGAKAGTLTIICGGDKQAFERSYNVLKVIGDYVIHVGPTGSGSVIKIINNMLFCIHTAAFSEALSVGAKAGVDLQLLLDLIKRSSGYSRVMDWDTIFESKPDQKINFTLLEKDLGLALNLAKDLGVPAEFAELTEKVVSTVKNH